jgi:hypothetical protein
MPKLKKATAAKGMATLASGEVVRVGSELPWTFNGRPVLPQLAKAFPHQAEDIRVEDLRKVFVLTEE